MEARPSQGIGPKVGAHTAGRLHPCCSGSGAGSRGAHQRGGGAAVGVAVAPQQHLYLQHLQLLLHAAHALRRRILPPRPTPRGTLGRAIRAQHLTLQLHAMPRCRLRNQHFLPSQREGVMHTVLDCFHFSQECTRTPCSIRRSP